MFIFVTFFSFLCGYVQLFCWVHDLKERLLKVFESVWTLSGPGSAALHWEKAPEHPIGKSVRTMCIYIYVCKIQTKHSMKHVLCCWSIDLLLKLQYFPFSNREAWWCLTPTTSKQSQTTLGGPRVWQWVLNHQWSHCFDYHSLKVLLGSLMFS